MAKKASKITQGHVAYDVRAIATRERWKQGPKAVPMAFPAGPPETTRPDAARGRFRFRATEPRPNPGVFGISKEVK